jgi:hypothetical protein
MKEDDDEKAQNVITKKTVFSINIIHKHTHISITDDGSGNYISLS